MEEKRGRSWIERFVTLACGYTSPTAASRFQITSLIFIWRASCRTEVSCVLQLVRACSNLRQRFLDFMTYSMGSKNPPNQVCIHLTSTQLRDFV